MALASCAKNELQIRITHILTRQKNVNRYQEMLLHTDIVKILKDKNNDEKDLRIIMRMYWE